jgi:hypothetical protein
MAKYKRPRYRIRFTHFNWKDEAVYIIEVKDGWFSWKAHWHCNYGDRHSLEKCRDLVRECLRQDNEKFNRRLRENQFRKTSVPEYHP